VFGCGEPQVGRACRCDYAGRRQDAADTHSRPCVVAYVVYSFVLPAARVTQLPARPPRLAPLTRTPSRFMHGAPRQHSLTLTSPFCWIRTSSLRYPPVVFVGTGAGPWVHMRRIRRRRSMPSPSSGIQRALGIQVPPCPEEESLV
jgi:hypothetical protein